MVYLSPAQVEILSELADGDPVTVSQDQEGVHDAFVEIKVTRQSGDLPTWTIQPDGTIFTISD
jgi:hypothetical protein